ncbi:hypothetical protein ACHAXR_001212 [Thalassiosira sp. AJA248-18]
MQPCPIPLSPTTGQAVTFSQFSKLVFIPKDDIESKWYSTQDKNRFRQSFIRDINYHSRLEATTSDRLYDCVGLGLDPLLNQDLMMRVAGMRRAHINAIHSEQRFQNTRVYVTWRNCRRHPMRVFRMGSK